ncbi:MAG: twin-arginine translocase subunit TatC, partial [Phycisphaeraceae bacterium]
VALLITFYFGFDLIAILAQPLLQAQYALGYTPRTIETEPTAGFTSVYLPVSLVAAIILASPWIIYQLWSFIVTGLYEHERRAMHILAPFSTIMTALGVAFTYYILLPVSLLFFLNFATFYPPVEVREPGPVMRLLLRAYDTPADAPQLETDPDAPAPIRFPALMRDPAAPEEGMVWINVGENQLKAVIGGRVRVLAAGTDRLITPMPRLGEYVRFAAFMMLGVVVAFQVPVVMLILGWTGLFDPERVAKARKYALFGCLALSALVTPADILSMIVLAMPLYALFELGLLLMRFAEHRAAPDDVP